MAGATQRRMDQPARPRAEEPRLSNGSNKVVRLPRAPDGSKSRIADEGARRERLAAILTQLVERDVVPRLLTNLPPRISSSTGGEAPALDVQPADPVPPDAPGGDAVIAFTETLLRAVPGEAAAIVERLRSSGVAAETLCLHLLTGAARHLGELWISDEASFADVTLATDQLHQIFQDLAPEISTPCVQPGAILLLATPGEQHSFGLSILAAFFRAAGWTAQTPRVRTAVDVQRRVASTPFDVLGFSLGAEINLTRLGRCIEVARRASCNRSMVIMVGGPVFVAQPELAAVVGADATASDAVGALGQAERLIRARRV